MFDEQRRRRRSALNLLVFTIVAPTLVACGGSVSAQSQANASSGSGAHGEVDFDAEANVGWETTDDSLSEEQTNATAEPSSPRGPNPTATRALLGARHDLNLTAEAPLTCNCLAVALGPETDARFEWRGTRPSLDRSSQLVIGLRPETSCDKSKSGASYMGYELRDGDVIVKVEAAVAGRPVTRGAIIPRPRAGKQVYIMPTGDTPYGKSLAGTGPCALGAGK